MNMQELLTYVEELTFKTSMFGYDKDEVDIQLDKICDEAEAIILAKEKEISIVVPLFIYEKNVTVSLIISTILYIVSLLFE